METLYRSALLVHVLAGTVGLLAMVPPLLARKGARIHRCSGFLFAGAMTLVVITGLVLASHWLLMPALFRTGASPSAVRLDAVFLSAIAALTGNAVLQAIRAIRRKRQPAPGRSPLLLGSLMVLALSGLLSLGMGLMEQHVLSTVFGAGCLVVAVRDARFTLRPLASRHAYLYQHIQAMGTACISAVTAFLVLGGQRFFQVDTFGTGSLVMWFLPGAIGGPLFQLWILHYKRKLEGPRTAPAKASVHASA
ncbi:MAG TPA: hypothetical protein VIM73_21090 [Polyangiaceae bacterium]